MKAVNSFVETLLAVYVFALKTNGENTWKYEAPFPPIIWRFKFPSCGGIFQSPIDLSTDGWSLDRNLKPFRRWMFDGAPKTMKMKNSGHTLQVDIENGYTIDEPGLLPGEFKVAQFHLHWGGSEHTIDKKRFFGELHIVHFNTKYGNIENAAPRPDGLAVCGIFIEDNNFEDDLNFNRILKPITENKVNYYNQAEEINAFSLATLLPHDLTSFFRYNGSLTTPPCYESVTWSVFTEPIRISKNQAEILESLVFSTEKTSKFIFRLSGNHRPIQPLNNRNVTMSRLCPY